MPPPAANVSVDCSPNVKGLDPTIVERAVAMVLAGEEIADAEFSVAFLSVQRMRALNRRLFAQDRATDVIAFRLPHPDVVVGDIYVCPSMASKSAAELNLSAREELLRLVVHGTLHSLGYDHPSGRERYSSEMWRLQEEYLREITGAAP